MASIILMVLGLGQAQLGVPRQLQHLISTSPCPADGRFLAIKSSKGCQADRLSTEDQYPESFRSLVHHVRRCRHSLKRPSLTLLELEALCNFQPLVVRDVVLVRGSVNECRAPAGIPRRVSCSDSSLQEVTAIKGSPFMVILGSLQHLTEFASLLVSTSS